MAKKIMVTGGTGYIGSWVVKELLERGHIVKLTVRDKSKEEKYNFLQEIANQSPGELEVYEANLLKFGSYDEAIKDCDTVVHMASPFILDVKDPIEELVKPALEGTENVLASASKAATVKKVILTSSVAAIYGDAKDMQDQGLNEFTEENWNTTSNKDHQPYPYSKTLAERKAWELHDKQEQWFLAVINPSFVMGPSLTKISNSESLKFMSDMLKGKMQVGAPDLVFGVVDVRDVAKAHASAVEMEDVTGRHILSNKSVSVLEMAEAVRIESDKKYKLPKSLSPKWLLYIVGPLFGINSSFVKKNIGYPLRFNNSKSIKNLEIDYRPFNTTMKDMVEQMEENNMIKN
ncbi:NAD-dependent epimerase/dehydratase family protein [Mangrovivirga cuniculi]|uniref:Diaminohydroxyphosphoribosylaminopyrimidine deaminase n=1 Tax=Mangrovivirga cuniculi TaxID=2715131 RepID=A0A4D7K625_9BACT|nr:NAD-dependent epimerase/dehydratase family protein [Mangrovivirga cuniculi]QCK14858.1 diaminohydroxyphosphoribosylaminopyrimidine deaminase [Mangrovivirga cuniculi]